MEFSKKSLQGQYLTFMLGSQHYAVPIKTVREINQITEITAVPKTPDFVRGVINLRGKITPVVDLKQKLGMERASFTKQTCSIVIETGSGLIGIVVDQVQDVVELTADQIEQSPNLGNEKEMDFLLGMGKLPDRVLILIDIVHALSKDNFICELKLNLNAAS